MGNANTNKLTDWVIDKIKKEYKDDIALLLAVKGHSINHDGHGEVFDFFIPETEKGCELSQTFIIDGVGHDLYPRSWDRMEKSAYLDEMTCVLANAEILYARSAAEIDRFHALQKKLEENLNDPVFVYRKALERLDDAIGIFRTLMFEDKLYCARSEAGYIHLYLSQAVAYLNNTFTDSPIYSEKQAYQKEYESRMYHCPDLLLVPDSFFQYARLLLTADSIRELRELTHKLIRTTRNFVLDRKPQSPSEKKDINYKELADWYQELSLTWRRIYYFCKQNMTEEAYIDACRLQSELLVIAQEFHIEELNLLGSFCADSLENLAARSLKLEQYIRQIIQENGIKINEYASLDEFLAENTGGNSL